MGSRKIAAAKESLASFTSNIHPSSTVVPVQLDITNESSIKAAHATIADYLKAKNLSGLDVLINNAGVLVTGFRENYEVNVFGTAAITESIRPLINPGGTIINISSAIGSIALLLSRTDLWAMEEQKKGSGIRVMSICPGYCSTNLNGHTGIMSPAEGCKIIVNAALETEGRIAVFFNKEGDLGW
ncbi:short-chain dehydrogenase/reductase SDR [Mycena latifolia]|nr:short-chain dehydrogenase/reductase SDR [Mycena latifolia]